MSEEGKFWVRIWSLVVVVVLAVIAGTTANFMYEKHLIDSAIAAGKDPAAARCAYDDSERYGAFCIIYVMQSGK